MGQNRIPGKIYRDTQGNEVNIEKLNDIHSEYESGYNELKKLIMEVAKFKNDDILEQSRLEWEDIPSALVKDANKNTTVKQNAKPGWEYFRVNTLNPLMDSFNTLWEDTSGGAPPIEYSEDAKQALGFDPLFEGTILKEISLEDPK